MRALWFVVLCVLAAPAAARSDVTPLFASDDPLAIEIEGPVRTIVRTAERSTDAYPATLRSQGQAYPVEIAARGNARRRKTTCTFPPLRVRFAGKPAKGSPFERQGSLKLVTHCGPRKSSEQQVLREYAAYRLYNVLTPQSLKVRLVAVRYLDDGKPVADSIGFFIEDADDAAARNDLREVNVPDTTTGALDRAAAARAALFQYMIGNNDFDLSNGPAGSDCCHNSKLLGAGKDARTALIPLPYDFDYSGLVDAPYAVPPEQLPIRSVKQRRYRGCGWRAETLQAIPAFRAAQPAMLAEIDRVPGMDERTKQAMRGYLGGFFSDIADPERTLFRVCS